MGLGAEELLGVVPLLQNPDAAGQAGAGGGEVVVHTEETFRFLHAPELWVIGLVILPATVLFVWWSYRGIARLEPRTRTVLSVLRFLAIALCCLLLFQPAWEITTWRKSRSQVHVLVDDSASMQRKDTYAELPAQRAELQSLSAREPGELTRTELVRAVLERPGGLLEQLRKDHDVRLFRVQRKPIPIRSLDELTARGNRTQLGDALDLHLGTAGSVYVDAVILVSDGRNNAGLDPVETAQKYAVRGIPVHTIGTGDPTPPRNAWVVGPGGPKEALREEEVAFDVTVRAEGLHGKAAQVELLGSRDDGSFVRLAQAPCTLPADDQAQRVRIYHAFQQAGDWTLRFQLSPQPEESQLDDNTDTRFLRVNDERIRVLYVEDEPRWEYRYLKNALKRVDPSIVVQAVLFQASPKFEQEHSKELPTLHDIPRTEKELAEYHVVLLGDVPPERIAPTEEGIAQWLGMLQRFVEFGGGAGFLFGDHAMPERYRNTPLQDLLPVVLEDPVWLQQNRPSREREFRPTIENPEQPHDILLLQRDPNQNRRLWEQGLRGLLVYHPVLRAKPGATVLLRHPVDQNRYGRRPIAVVSPHPRGNTFFIGTDETWRWRDPYGETYHDLFWRNVVRYLATGRLQRRNALLEMTVDKVVMETGDKVRVSLRVHDAELQPSTLNEYPVFLRAADGKPEKRTLRSVPADPGLFQGSFVMGDPGAFSFLVYTNNNTADTVLAREDVLVKIPDKELADSSLDQQTMQRIAEASSSGDQKARYLPLERSAELMADFQGRRPFESREETRTRPAWDASWSLFALLALLAAEWILRKRARLV
jgi:hypothetical protein